MYLQSCFLCMVLLLQLFPDFKGLFRRRNADEILQEKAVVELWGMLVSNFWQLLNMQSDLVSSPHRQALGCCRSEEMPASLIL